MVAFIFLYFVNTWNKYNYACIVCIIKKAVCLFLVKVTVQNAERDTKGEIFNAPFLFLDSGTDLLIHIYTQEKLERHLWFFPLPYYAHLIDYQAYLTTFTTLPLPPHRLHLRTSQ